MRGRTYWLLVLLTAALATVAVLVVQADLRQQQEDRDRKFQEETCRIFPTNEGCP